LQEALQISRIQIFLTVNPFGPISERLPLSCGKLIGAIGYGGLSGNTGGELWVIRKKLGWVLQHHKQSGGIASVS